jgi:hypothetical protein
MGDFGDNNEVALLRVPCGPVVCEHVEQSLPSYFVPEKQELPCVAGDISLGLYRKQVGACDGVLAGW